MPCFVSDPDTCHFCVPLSSNHLISFLNVVHGIQIQWGQSVAEFYESSNNADVWHSAFHWPSAGVQLQLLHCRQSRLELSLQAKEGSVAVGSFIIVTVTKYRLMMLIYGHTLNKPKTSIRAAKLGSSAVVIQKTLMFLRHNNRCKYGNSERQSR